MNLRFLKQLNEDHEKRMSSEEMVSYLKLLHKKCSKKAKGEFHEYLEKECDVEEVDFDKCCKMLCKDKDRCDKVIHHLENLSEKVDESALSTLLSKNRVLAEGKEIPASKMKDAYRLGNIRGYHFYEHPVHGDESPMVVDIDGRYYVTDFWEMGDLDSMEDIDYMLRTIRD